MKKLLLLCCLVVIGAGLLHATTTTYTSTSGSINTNAKTFKTGADDNSAALKWTYSSTNSINPEYKNTPGKLSYNFGNSNNPVGTLTLTTSSLSSKTITSVIFNGWGNAGKTSYDVAIKVGGTEFTPTDGTNISGQTVKNLEFTGNASGDIVITCTNKSKAGVNFCGVTVTYTDGSGSDPDPVAVPYKAPFEDQTYPVVEGGSMQLDLGTSHPALTFTPADSEIASVSADGLISAKKVGSQEFTATWSGSDDWVAGSAKFTVNVTEKPAQTSYGYILVTDFSAGLEDGQYIIACNSEGTIATEQNSTNGRNAVKATFSADLSSVDADNKYEFTIAKSADGTGYTIKDSNDKYLAHGSRNTIKTQATPATWTVAIADDGRLNFTNDSYWIAYNANQQITAAPFRAYTNNNQTAIQLYKLVTDPDAVAKPTITFADNKVTITSAEGTTVRYTTDGTTTPTATVGTEYKDPFTITASCTVKAVAIKDGKTSEVASLDVTYVEPAKPYANFAEMIAAGDKTDITVNGPLTAFYHSGKYLFVYDNAGQGMLLYSSTAATETYANGTQFADVKGEYTTNKYVQIKDYTLGAQSAGTAIEPTEITIADIKKDILFKYVTLKGVKYTPESGKAGTIALNGSTFATYNQFGIELPAEAKYVDLVAVIGIFNDNLQVQPISFTEVAGPEQVAMPVIAPDGGEVFVDTPITLSCATADAKIYYTTNSTTPTTSSTLYDAATPITLGTAGSATVKAIAVKDGMEASEVATATFTVKDYATPTGLKVLYHGEDANNTSLEVPVNNVYSFSCNDATKIVLKDALEETIIAELEGPNATYTFDNTDEVMVTVYGANDKYNSTEEKTFTVTVLKWLKEESYSTAGGNVTFDLTDLATVNSYSDQKVVATEGTNVHSVAGFKFTNDNVTFTVSENILKETEPNVRLKNGAYDLSVYEGSRLDITAPGNIKKITFQTTNYASINDAGNDYTFYIDNSTDSKTPQLTNIDNNTCVWVPAYETTNGYFLFSDDNDIASITVEMVGTGNATYSVVAPTLTFNEDHVYINTYPGAVLYIKKDTKAASAPMRVPYTSTWTSAESHEEMIGNDEHGKYLVKAVSNHDKFPKGMESEVVGFTIDNEGTVTGIEDVEAGAEEGEVEYFNLQGVRVMNPTKGIYIRKYGSKVTKVCL